MARTPTIGISTYNYPPEDMLNLARTADRLGFEGLWLGEHYVVPGERASAHPGLAVGETHDEEAIVGKDVRIYDPWFLLGAIAGATSRLKIGTAICVAPMLHPLFLARASATAADVSGGRFRLGVGAGWLREEFEALGIPFEARGARMDEIIDILKRAWQGGFFAHEGPYFRFESLQISPHAVDVPLVCGGNSGPALRRVARVADAWMNSAMVSLDDALKLRDGIESAMAVAGRTRPLTCFVRPQSAEAEEIERFVHAGFENIVLWGPHVWPTSPEIGQDTKIAGLERVAKALGVAVR